MWTNGHIHDGDSGATVSNKLDAEFQRLQQVDSDIYTKLNDLKYAEPSEADDPKINKKIISPYTLMHILTPMQNVIDGFAKVLGHISEYMIDGLFWLRIDAMFDYRGTFHPLKGLPDGTLITKKHLTTNSEEILNETVHTDGSSKMDAGYVPTDSKHIADKEYVDGAIDGVKDLLKSNYVEFPKANIGDKTFAAPLAGKKFVVFLNGIMQRQDKFGFSDGGISFHTPLQGGDEVTIFIAGDA